ncbi:Midkine-B [Acipenser ruthenus]|uniref:Midkine n=1 Tax=Acipenser ruthenus TaxID=7906 RepID=A0A444U0Y5_ACIRT|nr:Midkine-B [Acipenser ruthenus]
MRGLFSLVVVLLVVLMAVTSEAGKNKKDKGKGKSGSDCAEWLWGPCVPNSGDCGVGSRQGTCKEETKKLKCKVPCNWKKDFGADCKYKFGNWGECDTVTGVKNRSGTLKKAMYNAECLQTIKASKPCSPKTKSKSKGLCSLFCLTFSL